MDLKQILLKGNLLSYFKDNAAYERALLLQSDLCNSDLFKNSDSFTCCGVRCSECPLDVNNKDMLRALKSTSFSSLLPNPNVCEIADVNKYFPTIIEL